MTNDWPFGVATAINDHLQNLGFTTSLTHHDTTGGKSSYLGISDPQTGRYLNKIRMSDHLTGPIRASQETHINKPEDVRKIIDWANDLRAQGPTQYWKDKKALEDAGLGHLTGSKREKAITRLRQPLIAPISKQDGGMIDNPEKSIRRAVMVAKGLAKEIGPLPTGDHPKPPHPASMIPGVHVTGMGDEHTAIHDGYADGGDVTSNPNFSQWFGNSVAHDNGVPRTYYTGTSKDKDFTSFNVGRHGAWFTTDPHEASQYAENNDSQGHVWENGRFQPTNTASRVIPAYLKAENPYTGERPEAISRAQNYKKAQSDWFDQLRAAGHDAWIPSSLKGNLAVMLRHPTQIKSAIGNNGDFDPKQKAIHRADGGSTPAWQRKESQNPSGGLNSKARAIHKDGGGEVGDNPNFKKWFGDSKIVDGNGAPLRVFHGTSDSPSEFVIGHPRSKDAGWLGRGVYMTTSPDLASLYASLKSGRAHPNVMPLYAKVENPYIASHDEKKYFRNLQNTHGANVARDAAEKWTQQLKKNGHDGVMLHYPANAAGADESHEIVAFYPENVKSTFNKGSFSSETTDIGKASGGKVQPTDETGFDAWHGTPHTFAPEPGAPLGRFRSDKIGTGEGAQAYGHGLYLGAEGTAREYKENVKDMGKVADINDRMSSLAKIMRQHEIQGQYRKYRSPEGEKASSEYDALMDKRTEVRHAPGHLLHVRVRANPEHFLDWDKPLSEQHPRVQSALAGVTDLESIKFGGDAYQALANQMADKKGRGNFAGASAALHAAGIPGIRYLDANSRGSTGNPTHNHVIFDPSIIDIKHRYARGGDVGEYQGEHKAPSKDDGSPLHDVTGVYPPDVYGPNGFRYYGEQGNSYDRQAFNVLSEAKGRPYSSHTVYRAVPKDKTIKDINPGDWVALHPQYAKDHGDSALNGNYKILKKQ